MRILLTHPMLTYFITMCSTLTSGATGRFAEHDRGLTLDMIRKHVVGRHDRLNSLEVRYLQTTETSSGQKRYIRIRLVAKGRLRLRETHHSTDRYTEDVDLNHMTQFLTADSFDYFIHNSRYFERSRAGLETPARWKLKDDDYLRVSGWWPQDDEASSDPDATVPTHLRFLLEHDAYHLEPTSQEVDGRQCIVVGNPGRDRLWLDPALGYAVRRREIFDDSGRLIFRLVVKAFQRCSLDESQDEEDSIWMPIEIINQFEPDEPGVAMDERTGLATATVSVERIRLNRVHDSTFAFEPPPGTLIYDRDSNTSRMLPGGRGLLDKNIEMQRKRGRIGGAVKQTSVPPSLLVSVIALVVANVFCFSVIRSGHQ